MEISILPSDIINILADLKKIRQVSKRNKLLKKKCGIHHKMHNPKDVYLGKYQKYRIEKKINEANLIYLIVHLKEVVLLTILTIYPKFASEHQYNKEFYSLPYLLNYLINKMHHLPKPENLKLETTNVRGGATNVRGGATNVRGGATNVRGGATNVRGGAKKNKFGNNLNNELENYFESNDMDASNRQRKSATKNDSSEYELNDDTYISTDYESSAFHRQLLQQQKLLRQLDRLKYMKKLKNKDVQLLSDQLTSIERMLDGADLTKIIPTVGDEPIPSRFKTVVDGVDLREIPNEKREQFLQIIKRKNEIDARIEQLRKQKDSLALLNNSENKNAKIAKVKEEASQLKQERDVILGQIKQMKNEKKQQIQKLREESEKENSVPLFTKKFGSLAPYNLQNVNEESQNDTAEYLSMTENSRQPNATQTNVQPNNSQAAANSAQANANNSQRRVQRNNLQAKANSAQANNLQAAANSAQANNLQAAANSAQANNLQAAANSAQANNLKANNLQPTNVNVKSQNQKEVIKRSRKPEKEQIVEVFANINKLREHYQRGVILFRRLVGLIIYDKHLHMIVTYISNNWETLKTQIYTKLDLYNRSLNLYNIISNKNKIIMSDLKKAVDENKKEYMQLLNSEILPFISEDSEYILTVNSLNLVEPIFNQVNTEFNSIKAHYAKLRDENDIQNYKIMDVETYDIVQPSAKLFRDFAILANINVDEGTESLASVTPSNNSLKLYTNLKSKFSNQKQNGIKVNETASTVKEITTENVKEEEQDESEEFFNTQSQFNEEEGTENLKLNTGEDEGEDEGNYEGEVEGTETGYDEGTETGEDDETGEDESEGTEFYEDEDEGTEFTEEDE
jgi:hypothetical protein